MSRFDRDNEGTDWFRGMDLSPSERVVWEDKVRFALYGENARARADVDRKAAKENAPGPGDDDFAEHEALD